VGTPASEQILAESAEQPYREMIEAMSEGTVNITADGMVLLQPMLRPPDPGRSAFDHGSSLLMYFVDRDRATIAGTPGEP
jgi:hypothetical protein